MTKLSSFVVQIIDFINNFLVPLIFAVAFIVLLYGIARYMIAGAANVESRKTGRDVIIYSIIGFAIMISIWGLINLVKNSFGLESNSRPCLPTFNKDPNCTDVPGTSNTTGGTGTTKDVVSNP